MSQTDLQEPGSLPPNTETKQEEEEAQAEPLEGEALREALKNKIEYLFSKENLAQSQNLFTLVNSELLVSVDSLCSRLETLTKEKDLILDVLRSLSDKITFDESTGTVKPKFKRNTIILRDIPNTIDKEKIKELFDDPEKQFLKKIVNIRPDVGDTWFISFEDEDITADAFFFVRSKKLDGKLVQARIKSETFQKSFDFPSTSSHNNNTNTNNNTSAQNPVDQSTAMYPGPIPYSAINNLPPMNQRYPMEGWDFSLSGRTWHGSDSAPMMGDTNYQKDYRYDKNKPRYGGRGRRKDGYPPMSRKNYREGGEESNNQSPNNNNNGNNNNNNNNRRGRGNRKGRKVDRSRASSHPVQLGPSHFPPLPNRNGNKQSSGYQREFKKYNKEQFVAIIGATEDILDPQFDDPDCLAISTHTHKELEISKPLPPNTKMYSDLIESKHHKKARSRSQSQLSKDSNASLDENSVASDSQPNNNKKTNAPSYKDTVKKKLTNTQNSSQPNGRTRNSPNALGHPKSTKTVRSELPNASEKAKTEPGVPAPPPGVPTKSEPPRASTSAVTTSYADIARVSSAQSKETVPQITSPASSKKSNGAAIDNSTASSTGE